MYTSNTINKGLKNRLFSCFPFIEVMVRKIYWKNIRFFNYIKLKVKFTVYSSSKVKNAPFIDFKKIVDFLKDFGIKEGDTLLVHSSYDSIKNSRKLPKHIVNDLVELVGESGNLVMPANRVFDYSQTPVKFDVNKTRVWSGALPFAMLLRKDSEKSRFPINSVVVIGANAKEMVADNIEGELLTPCGLNSAWYKCYQQDAFILGLGIDLTHSLTMTHVVEDSWEEDWPIQNWYDTKTYHVLDNEFSRVIKVRQRKDIWGKYYFAERRLASDLKKAGVLKEFVVEGVDVQIIKSVELIDFLRKKSKNGYPFYGLQKFKK